MCSLSNFFFFSSRRRHTRWNCDWSSDVCSSDLSCHTHSDPIGLSLEGFDTIGGRRTTENGQKIDLSATIQGKSFVGAEGLGHYLHDNPKYTACIARKLHAYALGQNS